MPHPESPPAGDKRNLMEILKELLNKILGEKHKHDLVHEAQEEQKRKKENESVKRREEERRKKEEADALRKRLIFDERRSTQERVESEDYERVKTQIHSNTLNDAKSELNNVVTSTQRTEKTGYEGSYYVFEDYIGDEVERGRLERLMENNSVVGEAVYELAKKNSEINSDPGKLLYVGRSLYLNTEGNQDAQDVLESIFTKISERVKQLIKSEIDSQVQTGMSRNWKQQPEDIRRAVRANVASAIKPLVDTNSPEVIEWLNMEQDDDIEHLLTSTYNRIGEVAPSEGRITPGALSLEAKRDIDRVWDEVADAQRSNKTLSADKLDDIQRAIYKAESDYYPKDEFPNSTDYLNAVNASHEYSEGKLNSLAGMLKERLEREGPQVKKGIISKAEFFSLMDEHPGNLGSLLNKNNNPEMYKLFTGTEKDSFKFRNQIFLRIHNSILSQRRESSNDNFGLYERADFTAFTSIMRNGMKDISVKETGESLGQTWVDYYTGLSNTIRHSRDIDFWTSQPGATMEQLQKSMIMFQNEYTVQAMSIPAVEQAFRAYETALTSIRDSNDGYISPSLIDYDPVNMTSRWDVSAQNMLSKMIARKVVKDADREFKRTGGMPQVEEDGVTLSLGEAFTGIGEGETEVDPLELKMYMTLAKGFGMVSMRLPEIIANSKIPGAHIPGFRSPAFEGIITALNHWNVFIKKWSHYTYKYFHMINTIQPMDKKLPVGEGGAELVYRAMLDGTFREKYGDEAYTMLQAFNYSKTHGALGPTTPWRTMDTTTGWTDKQRELMGGATRLAMAHRLVGDERLRDAFVGQKYKEEFRVRKRAAGQASSGSEFEALWQSEGQSIYGNIIDKEWEAFQHHHSAEVGLLKTNLQNVFRSRVWIETAMKNPQAIAHYLAVDVPIAGYDGEGKIVQAGEYKVKQGTTRQIKLHSYIIQKVLGITPEDLETGTVIDGKATYKINAAKYNSLTKKQWENMSNVLDLEGDLAAVREVALEERRELTDNDFRRVINGDSNKNTARSDHAIAYWREVKKFITGNEMLDIRGAKNLYEQLGISYHIDQTTGEEMDYYNIEWEKIKDANAIFSKLGRNRIELSQQIGSPIIINTPKAFNSKFLGDSLNWYFSTDDTAFRKMSFLNLGNRQWVRRGGDVSAHYQGGLEIDKYFDTSLTPDPDVGDLAKQLMAIRQAYQGDNADIGHEYAANLGYMTCKLYEMVPKYGFQSVAQRDVWNTRRHVAAWTANGRRKFWDAVEHIDVIPPHAHFPHWSPGTSKLANVHKMEELTHSTNGDVWTEILLLGVALAVAMTIWRAFTAKSEEEEGGGGGH